MDILDALLKKPEPYKPPIQIDPTGKELLKRNTTPKTHPKASEDRKSSEVTVLQEVDAPPLKTGLSQSSWTPLKGKR